MNTRKVKYEKNYYYIILICKFLKMYDNFYKKHLIIKFISNQKMQIQLSNYLSKLWIENSSLAFFRLIAIKKLHIFPLRARKTTTTKTFIISADSHTVLEVQPVWEDESKDSAAATYKGKWWLERIPGNERQLKAELLAFFGGESALLLVFAAHFWSFSLEVQFWAWFTYWFFKLPNTF